jgi:protein phosphatase
VQHGCVLQDRESSGRGGSQYESPAEIEAVATSHPNVITRALGTADRIDIDVQYSQVNVGDLYLLCTDGLTRQLPDGEVRTIISDDTHSLAERCERLVRTADDRVGHDNVTALLVRVR